MTRNAIGLAVLGCGARGKQHAAAWAGRDDGAVAAVFDRVEEARNALAEQHGAVACATVEEAVQRDDVDAVCVCSPASFHKQHVQTAIDAGKHVLCEKPLGMTTAEADPLIEAAEAQGVYLTVCFQKRHAWAWSRMVRAAVADGRLEGPLLARVAGVVPVRPKRAMHMRSMNNGPVLDLGGHFTDMMRWWTGAEPRRVYATGHVFGGDKPELAGIEDLAIDAALIHVAFDDGSAMEQMLHWGMPNGFPGRQTPPLVLGRNGAMGQGEDGMGLVVGAEVQPVEPHDQRELAPLHDLADAVAGGSAPEITAWDGRQAVAVSEAAFASIEGGEAVEIGPARVRA